MNVSTVSTTNFKTDADLLASMFHDIKNDYFISNSEFNKLSENGREIWAKKYGHFQNGFYALPVVYQYIGTIRPVSSFTVPYREKNLVITQDSLPALKHRQYGSVFYDSPLTLEEITHFSLIPVYELTCLVGHKFADESFEGLTYTVAIDENFCITVTSDFDGQTDSMNYNVKQLLTNILKWSLVAE